MDHESLRTASTYLNNLLLARGLLRHGEPIDFVKPSKESRAQIINLVHDLILREDRDKDQHERTADTLRAARAEDARKAGEIERLITKHDESARAAVQAQAAERAAQAELKKMEKAMKALQDQATKLKTTMAQVKTQCTNDVRRRDLELARLKTHLQGQQRGNKVGMAAPSMTVRKQDGSRNHAGSPLHDLRDPEYSLKQETTEFLTQLSQSLSDENDGLIGLIRSSLSTLRELLGDSRIAPKHPDSAVGSMGSVEEAHGAHKAGSNIVQALPASYETLASDMDTVLSQVKTILTNPNFVSVEEVEVREEEIGRLREGWEHMEHRWREVLRMMEGWIRRMNTGESINMEDLRKGMGLVSPEQVRRGRLRVEPEQSFVDSDVSEIRIPEISSIEDSSMVAPDPPPHSSPFRSNAKRKWDALEPPKSFDLRPSSNGRSAPASPKRHDPASHAAMRVDEGDESEELEVPHMTIEEKLSAAQEEAEEAVRARTAPLPEAEREDARSGQRDINSSVRAREDDTLGKIPSPMAKRTKIRGRPRKRKSTLTPEEFNALIGAAED